MAIQRNAVYFDVRGLGIGRNPVLRRNINLALRQIGQNVKRQMRRRVRVRTGRLRSSIYTRGGNLRQVVGFNESVAPYAKYVEFGTRYFPGDHIMEQAVVSESVRSGRLIMEAIAKSEPSPVMEFIDMVNPYT